MRHVDDGQDSKNCYADLAKAMGQDDYWGIEIFIGKAQAMVHQFKAHCIRLEHYGPQEAMNTYRLFQWYLRWFPLMNYLQESQESSWIERY